jgi:hypothetical protein
MKGKRVSMAYEDDCYFFTLFPHFYLGTHSRELNALKRAEVHQPFQNRPSVTDKENLPNRRLTHSQLPKTKLHRSLLQAFRRSPNAPFQRMDDPYSCRRFEVVANSSGRRRGK